VAVVNRILIVDDDPGVSTALRMLFERAGHAVLCETDGRQALRAVHADRPDAVILDIAMPAMDGWTVLDRIREISDVPVLMLSVRGRQMDKVRGLRSGADDYVTKPFANAELLARVEALLRRAPIRRPEATGVYDDGHLTVDPVRREIRLDGRDVAVTPTEYRLLRALVSDPGAVVTAEQLLATAWDDASGYRPERVKFAVMRLRRKLGWSDPGTSPLQSVRGFGYRYRPPDAD
jgi:DNA-binding response OmpR family regulator